MASHSLGSSLVTAFAFALSCAVASASTWHVAPAGSDEGDGSTAAPFATVAKAVQSAAAGDTILIGSGQYSIDGWTRIYVDRANLVFEGGMDTNTWTRATSTDASTIFASNGCNPVVQLLNGAQNTTFRNITVTTPNPAYNWTGVRFDTAAGETLFDSCVITNCGTGVLTYNYNGQNITMRNCLVAHNAGYGVFYNVSDGTYLFTADNCTFADNGVAYRTGQCNPDHADSSFAIRNCIFAHNGIGVDKRGNSAGSTLDHCLFSGNGGGHYSYQYAAIAVTDCFDGTPMFVDHAAGDYRLSDGSAASGAGADLSSLFTTDITGATRTGDWDVGCYGTSVAGAPAELALSYVDGVNGIDAIDGGSDFAPFKTIAFAVSRTAADGEIRIAGGTYSGDAIGLGLGKSGITVRGGYDPTDWSYSPATQETIVDGLGKTPASVSEGGSPAAFVSLTLRGGTGSEFAGLRSCVAYAAIDVQNCRLTGNYYGFLSDYSQPPYLTFRNCVIDHNASHAVHCYQPNAQGYVNFLNCTVADNGGCGFWLRVNADWPDVVPSARNTIFANNNGFGIAKRGAYPGAVLQNNLFFRNTAGAIQNYGNSKFDDLGGNITSLDPLFADAANGDYSLLAGSPALGAGADISTLEDFPVSSDIAGVARPQNGWDIGAFESADAAADNFLAEAYVSTTGSDTTGDGSSTAPFATVTHALSRIASDGVIRVAGGDYPGTLVFDSSRAAITVQGAYDPATWTLSPATQSTVLRAPAASANVVEIMAGSSSNRFSHLTLTGASGNNPYDGCGCCGIEVLGTIFDLVADHCVISNNFYALHCGTYIQLSAQFRNCLVAANRSHAIFLEIRGANIYQNWGDFLLYNCTIAGNGGDGYRIEGNDDWATIAPYAYNTIFANNGGFGIKRSGQYCAGIVSNCYFNANNSGDTHLKNGGLVAMGGCKSGRDVQFVDPANGDYHLQSSSPANAAGLDLSAALFSVTDDLEGVSRPQGDAWDIGCFESDGVGDAVLTLLDDAYVSSSTGSDTEGDGSMAKPWATINQAMSFTTSTGTIHVAAGTYAEAIVFPSERSNSAIIGGYNPDTWELAPLANRTTIATSGAIPVSINADANGNLIANLTITGGTAGTSAGIYFVGASQGNIVEGCTIYNNYHGVRAAGCRVDATLRNCAIVRNNYHGIYGDGGATGMLEVQNCVLADNWWSGFNNYGNPDWSAWTPFFRNCIISRNGWDQWGNRSGHGIETRGRSAQGLVDHCLFYDNAWGATVDHAAAPIMPGTGNLSGRDPLFTDPANLDYSLRPGSPALDAGTNLVSFGVTTDIAGNARPATDDGWDLGIMESAAAPAPALPDTVYVATTGSNEGDGSQANPFASVQYGFTHVAPGGLVKVAAGTYNECVRQECGQTCITVRGGYDPETWTHRPNKLATVINGNGFSPMSIHLGANSNTFAHVTLTGGWNWNSFGVTIDDRASGIAFESCKIVGNRIGISATISDAEPYFTMTLRNCLIADNTSYGAYFPYNSDWMHGRGLAGEIEFINCTIANNGDKGLLLGNGGDRDFIRATLWNTIVANNAGWGIYNANTMNNFYSVKGSVGSCLFYGNTEGPWYGAGADDGSKPYFMQDLEGNLYDADPLFTSADAANPYALGDGSPAINAGTNSVAEFGITVDILGNRRCCQRRYDIGAYEFQTSLGTLIFLK